MSFRDLEFAFEEVSCGEGMDECSAYISKKTGKVVYYTPEDISGEPAEEWVLEDVDYIQIPDKYELDLGNRLAFRFVEESLPSMVDEVRDIFRCRGAYGRFKALMDRVNLLQAWYDYEAQQTSEALRKWCEAEGVSFEDDGGDGK